MRCLVFDSERRDILAIGGPGYTELVCPITLATRSATRLRSRCWLWGRCRHRRCGIRTAKGHVFYGLGEGLVVSRAEVRMAFKCYGPLEAETLAAVDPCTPDQPASEPRSRRHRA